MAAVWTVAVMTGPWVQPCQPAAPVVPPSASFPAGQSFSPLTPFSAANPGDGGDEDDAPLKPWLGRRQRRHRSLRSATPKPCRCGAIPRQPPRFTPGGTAYNEARWWFNQPLSRAPRQRPALSRRVSLFRPAIEGGCMPHRPLARCLCHLFRSCGAVGWERTRRLGHWGSTPHMSRGLCRSGVEHRVAQRASLLWFLSLWFLWRLVRGLVHCTRHECRMKP